MMKRIVGWFVLVPLCALIILFALANRQTISISFNPFGAQASFFPGYDIPAFVLIYAMLLLGIVLGGVATWLSQGRNRREKRRLKRENAKLTKEIASAQDMARQIHGGQAVLGPDDLLEDA